MSEQKVTRLFKVDPEKPDAAVLAEAGAIVKRGGLVAFPTETVYGLGGDALNPEAASAIYEAKGRPSDNPLIVHIADIEALGRIAADVPEGAERLAECWWPGPLTMIFEKKPVVPDATSGGLPTVAVRMPAHAAALGLIRASGGYIAAPSANTSGRPSPTCAEHVMADLNGKIDAVLDGGSVRIGLESTIVDFTEDVPVILRPGFINARMLEEILGEVRVDPGILSDNPNVRPKAPGMRYRHYAPRAKMTLVDGNEEAVVRYIREKIREAHDAGLRCAVLTSAEHAKAYEADSVRILGARSDERELARHLYSALRGFDDDGIDVIYSEVFDTPQMGRAIMNRLLKAAGYQIVTV